MRANTSGTTTVLGGCYHPGSHEIFIFIIRQENYIDIFFAEKKCRVFSLRSLGTTFTSELADTLHCNFFVFALLSIINNQTSLKHGSKVH